jgi:hypothetical protein
MRYPLNSVTVTQEFGSTAVDYSQFGLIGHHGIDLQANVGVPVYAPENGKVLQSANGVTDPKSGRFAAGETIVMSGQYEHWLMHLSKRIVNPGQTVTEGQLIGYSGNTGFSTGPHLHWGTRPLNPDMNNGYRGFINPKYVIKETSMADKIAINGARILAEGILGRNRDYIHAGKGDADLIANHVGKDLTNAYLQGLWTSPEAVAAASLRAKQAAFYSKYVAIIAELSSRPTKAELDAALAKLATEQAKVTEAEKKLAEEQAKKTEDTQLLDEGKGVFAWITKLINRVKG